MTIFLLRHGESTGDIEDRFGGIYDDYLTDRGRAQAHELAAKLQNKGIEIIFTSPYHRAEEVAQIISKIIQAPVEIVNDLREHNIYGVMSGLVKAEMHALHPDLQAKLSDRSQVVEGAEPYADFVQRMSAVFAHLSARGHTTIAIVTHGGQIRAFARHHLGIEVKKINDCAILELETTVQGYTVRKTENIELAEDH